MTLLLLVLVFEAETGGQISINPVTFISYIHKYIDYMDGEGQEEGQRMEVSLFRGHVIMINYQLRVQQHDCVLVLVLDPVMVLLLILIALYLNRNRTGFNKFGSK
jgi:hypothetical protein